MKDIAAALNKAQASMGAAKKGAKNPFFKSTYADLNSVIEAVKEPLNDNGITILQRHALTEHGPVVRTTLLHVSGQAIESDTPIITAKEKDPQALGSAISYARRYGLQSLLSLPADDDDGESAMARKPTKSAPRTKGDF